MPVNLATLDAAQLRTYMQNARRLKNDEAYNQAFAALCILSPGAIEDGSIMDDPIVQRFWQAVTAAEQIKTEANGRTTRLSRTRQKASKDGVIATMEAMACKPQPSEGFHILRDGGFPQFVFEYIIAEYPARFSPVATAAAKARLDEFDIALPDPKS